MGSRSRPLGRLVGGEDGLASGHGAATSSGRLGSLGDLQGHPIGGGADAGGGLSPTQQPRLTPAQRFKPRPQPRSTRRASIEPKADPDPPSTRTTRARGGAPDEGAPSPSGRRTGNGIAAAAAPAIKPDPDATEASGAAARARLLELASASDSSDDGDEYGGGRPGCRATGVLSASALLRADVSADFPYAARLARKAPPPLDLAPPPGAACPSASPPGGGRHFPVSAFGTGLGGGLTLLQLPDLLPASATDRTPPPPPADSAGAGSGRAEAPQGCASIADLPPGVIGRVLVMASGAVKVHIGDVEYDLVPGMPVASLAAGVRLDMSGCGGGGGGSGSTRRTAAAHPSASAPSLGQVINRATLVPDVGRLLAGGAAPEYRRAAGFKGPRALDAEWAPAQGGGPTPPGQRRVVVVSDDTEDDGPAPAPGRTGRVVMDESD